MKRTILFLVINLLINISSAYSQTAKITSDDVTQAQLEKQKRTNEWIKKSEEYHKLRNSLNLPEGNRKFPFQNLDSKTQVERGIKESEEILRDIQLNPKLWVLAKEVDALANKIGKSSNYYSKLNAQVKNAENNVRNGKNRLNEIVNKQKDKHQHNQQMLDLDKELQGLKNKSKSIDNELTSYSKKGKNIDDFLATKTPKSNKNNVDFLSKETKTNSNNTDFLSKTSTNGDFISEKTEKEDYKIDYKDGKQGVVSKSGKLLVPYKNWKIVEYKSGIAKVNIDLDSYSCTGNSLTAYKEGFVDASGNFLDGFDVNFRSIQSNYYNYARIKLVKTKDYGDGYKGEFRRDEYEKDRLEEERIKREEERKKRELEIKKQKCNNDIQEWKLRILRQYQR